MGGLALPQPRSTACLSSLFISPANHSTTTHRPRIGQEDSWRGRQAPLGASLDKRRGRAVSALCCSSLPHSLRSCNWPFFFVVVVVHCCIIRAFFPETCVFVSCGISHSFVQSRICSEPRSAR